MASKNLDRKNCRIGLETLESRQLLSGSPSRQAILGAGARVTAVTAVPITLHLAGSSAPAGDNVAVASKHVVLRGQTSPGMKVALRMELASGKMQTVATTHASSKGNYRFSINCGMGTTPFVAQVREASVTSTSAMLPVTRANQAIVWNSIALQAVRTAHSQAPDSSRAYAIVAISVYDAVNAIHPQYASYGNITARVARGTSADAAAAAAAETALAALFPQQTSVFAAELNATLAAIPAGRGRDLGVALGTSVANQVLAMRSNDGSGTKVNYVPGTGPDSWVPTPPAHAAAVDPQWGNVTPFALSSGSQFQPPPPPSITSAQFEQEVNQVETLGGTTSTVRTADQTALAHFWADLAGTFDPPGHWNQITEIAAMQARSNLETSARSFALVDIALADAGIEAWNVKYAYNTARPVTIIRDGASGLNPGITADPTWSPLWSTPAFPSYISGHSTFSASAAAVLTAIYGKNFAFTDSGDPTVGLTPRHFTSFEAAAQEAGISRIYGGIHFMSDNTAGLLVGGEVGQYVVGHELALLRPGKG
jgi:membrane-associated phospholipid phosphatase